VAQFANADDVTVGRQDFPAIRIMIPPIVIMTDGNREIADSPRIAVDLNIDDVGFAGE
jgi:hypothetical protein